MLVIGRSYWVVPRQDEDDAGEKSAEETTEKSSETGTATETDVKGIDVTGGAATKGTGEEADEAGKTKFVDDTSE